MEVLHAAAARAPNVTHDPADPVEVEQPSPDLMPVTPPASLPRHVSTATSQPHRRPCLAQEKTKTRLLFYNFL